jgi:hypothetical protein
MNKTFGAVLALMAAMVFASHGLAAADNPLIGTWKWDYDKTLREFRLATEGFEQWYRNRGRFERWNPLGETGLTLVPLFLQSRECRLG